MMVAQPARRLVAKFEGGREKEILFIQIGEEQGPVGWVRNGPEIQPAHLIAGYQGIGEPMGVAERIGVRLWQGVLDAVEWGFRVLGKLGPNRAEEHPELFD